jgi:uncharacterized protein (TIGR02271 family)
LQIDAVTAWRGRNLVDRDGDKIGTIEEIYLDAETDQPEWLAVKTGLFGKNLTFVPIAEASERGGDVTVPYEKAQIKDAPSADADGQLSQDEEAALYRHYGLEYTEMRSDTGLPEGSGTTSGHRDQSDFNRDPTPGGSPGVVGNDVSGPETDEAMTRSEEELRVGTRQRETGRVRLRKHIVSEPVSQSVRVEREEARVQREPITDANRDAALSGGDLTEEEHEVTLRAQEPVVEKQVVPKERVRLDKDVTTEQREVSEDVRREEIEVEGDDPGRRR